MNRKRYIVIFMRLFCLASIYAQVSNISNYLQFYDVIWNSP
ncbi:MAG: hypothetical protein Q8907_05545 [Bacteroidota bacterium]|nr:hypothetical protein [Bacteroidota bacterium]MDP4273729.1 hypothetical protein [Bacteroidota bacterium]